MSSIRSILFLTVLFQIFTLYSYGAAMGREEMYEGFLAKVGTREEKAFLESFTSWSSVVTEKMDAIVNGNLDVISDIWDTLRSTATKEEKFAFLLLSLRTKHVSKSCNLLGHAYYNKKQPDRIPDNPARATDWYGYAGNSEAAIYAGLCRDPAKEYSYSAE